MKKKRFDIRLPIFAFFLVCAGVAYGIFVYESPEILAFKDTAKRYVFHANSAVSCWPHNKAQLRLEYERMTQLFEQLPQPSTTKTMVLKNKMRAIGLTLLDAGTIPANYQSPSKQLSKFSHSKDPEIRKLAENAIETFSIGEKDAAEGVGKARFLIDDLVRDL